MTEDIKRLFPAFSKTLLDEIEQNALFQSVHAGDVIMRTGQHIKHGFGIERNNKNLTRRRQWR